MLTYIIRRLLLMVPTLLGITAVAFFVMALSPGGFAGMILNQQGGQTEGKQSLAIREYFMRRYGLDQPAIVQYGRWLNQISPLGFATSAKLTFADAQKQAARAELEAGPVADMDVKLDEMLHSVLAAAAYTGQSPRDMAAKLNAALQAPATRGPPLLEKLSPPPGDTTAAQLRALSPHDRAAGQKLLLDQFNFLAATSNRILLDHPEFKVPSLGLSVHQKSVAVMIGEALPITLLLNVITIPLIYVIAIVVGIYAARQRGQWFDISSGVVLLALWSIPTIWAGVVMIGYLANQHYINWFPIGGLHSLGAGSMPFLPHWTDAGFQRGWLLDEAWHLVLPVICLAYGGFAVLAKLTRGAVLENLTADFVRTARAKGVSDRHVLFRHVLRNSLLPLITVAASILPAMLSGALIVETIFSINGMGKLMVSAAFDKDRELVMAVTLISGLLILVSWLIRDICYAIADPRVSYE